MSDKYDLIVIGGGSAGFAGAMRAAQLGGKVALVEGAHFGGNCMNKACIPSKVLMVAARGLIAAARAGRLGLRSEPAAPDMEALHARREMIIESLRLGTEELLTERGIELVRGRGRLAERDLVDVDGRRLPARTILLAPGSVPAPLPVAGSDLSGIIGTEEAITLREAPASIAIIVNRPWHLELAQYFAALGSEVTLIAGPEGLLAEADHEIAGRMGKHLHDTGISIRRNAAVEAIRPAEGGRLHVVLAGGGPPVEAERVLATRRFPNSTGLGLREAGVEMDAGAVRVDAGMRSSVHGILAAGDLTGSPMWSHRANGQGIIAGETAMGRKAAFDAGSMPIGLYTWPEVAWVGLSEIEAEQRGLEYKVGKAPLAINPFAMILDETAGLAKVIAGRHGKILGVHLMGPGATDLINAAAVAMMAEATVDALMRLIPKHPSIGEALVDAAMDVERRSLHLPAW